MVVAGDFNARVGGLVDSIADHITYPRGRWLLQEMLKRGFRLLNGTKPLLNGGYTFTNRRGSSTVDLVFVFGEVISPGKIGEDYLQVGNVNKALSDHAPILLLLPMSS